MVTYALNRLPPLYACSERGFEFQYLRGQRSLNNQIEVTVEQAIATISNNPRPLQPSAQSG